MTTYPMGPATAVAQHRAQRPPRAAPDPIRIAGISGTLLFNSVLCLVLLVPMARPDLVASPEPVPRMHWITPAPVPPLPPVEVAVVAPRAATPQPAPVAVVPLPAAATALPVADAGPVVDAVAAPADIAIAATPAAGNTPGIDAAVEGAQLQYATAPPPPYPRDALLGGVEGTVLLRVTVGTDGAPREVSIHRSSGNRRLDEAARRHVLRSWRFQPASRDGAAVEAIGIVPIAFSLSRG